jgi:hypothetical protein
MKVLWERVASLDPRWRPILTGLFLVASGAIMTTNVLRRVLPTSEAPGDYGIFAASASALLRGHWSAVFADPTVQAGPLELAFVGLPQLLGIHGAEQWAIYCILVSGLGLVAVLAVITWLLRESAPGWRVVLASAAVLLIALSGLVDRAVVAAHPADVAIPLLWLISAALAARGGAFASGVLLGLTAGWELWGVLGAPIVLLAPRYLWRRILMSAAGGVGALALLFAPFLVAGPFQMFGFSWPIDEGTIPALLFSGERHFTWPMRLAQGSLSIAGGVVLALLVRVRLTSIWIVPLAVTIVRLFFDPVLIIYYGTPVVVLASMGLMASLVQRRIVSAVALLAMDVVMIEWTKLYAWNCCVLVALLIATSIVEVRASRVGQSDRRHRAVDLFGVAK